MKADGNKPTLSRRDFVATAAVSICGMTATLLSGAADAAQESERRTPSGVAASVMNKLIITVSPSGADPHQTSRTDIAKDPKRHADAILEGFQAGASVVHIRGASAVEKNPDVLHGHGADLDNWKEVTDLVRSRCNIVINYGSSAMEPLVRKSLLTLKPEAASFLVGHHYNGGPAGFPAAVRPESPGGRRAPGGRNFSHRGHGKLERVDQDWHVAVAVLRYALF